jgi:hypothetical protein
MDKYGSGDSRGLNIRSSGWICNNSYREKIVMNQRQSRTNKEDGEVNELLHLAK